MDTSPKPDHPAEPDTVLIDLEGLLQPGDTSTVFLPDGSVVISDDE